MFRLELLRRAWDLQRDILYNTYIKSSGKGMKAKLKKLNLLTDSIRQEFLVMYFKRQKLLFIIKFLELHTEFKSYAKIKKYNEMLQKIEIELGLNNLNEKNKIENITYNNTNGVNNESDNNKNAKTIKNHSKQ